MQKSPLVLWSIIGAIALVIGAVIISSRGEARTDTLLTTPGPATDLVAIGNASLVDGVQYVDLVADAGYTPRVTKAQAGIPTVIRMRTDNTYDCSTALIIRDLSYQKRLPPTGVEEIPVPADKAQGTLTGRCSMGMYDFSIVFE